MTREFNLNSVDNAPGTEREGFPCWALQHLN
jgi:hypothetical protein